jgi:hypothetical protein
VFEYEVVPVVVTRGAGDAAADEEWQHLRAALNQWGQRGFRVVAVTEGAEGRAIIMERSADGGERPGRMSITQAAEEITKQSSRAG